MNIKLDLYDRKILHELDKNARVQFSTIGKKLGLSEAVVRYRVKRLEDAEILKGYLTFIDTTRIGYHFFNAYIKFKVLPAEEETHIIEQLQNLPAVCWLASCANYYNLIVCCLARDAKHFKEVSKQIVKVLEHNVAEESIFIVTDARQKLYPLLPDQEYHDPPEIGTPPETTLDNIDMKLLEILSQNARVSILELSHKLKTTIKTASEHYNKLLKNHMIQAFKPLIDMEKLGKQWHLVLFRFKYVDEETKKEFMNTLKSLPETFFIVNGIGNWEMQVEFYCDDEQQLRNVMNTVFPTKNSSIIKEYQVMRITKEHKSCFYPIEQTKLEKWTKKTNAEEHTLQIEVEEIIDK